MSNNNLLKAFYKLLKLAFYCEKVFNKRNLNE